MVHDREWPSGGHQWGMVVVVTQRARDYLGVGSPCWMGFLWDEFGFKSGCGFDVGTWVGLAMARGAMS